MNKRVLLISDQHFPYNHPDIIAFLTAIKKRYRPDRIINLGDELDYHAISFHNHDPDLMSPSDELQTAINRITPLYKLFPKMDLLESNHGSLVYRKGKFGGLPMDVFKSYREVLGAPKGWNWHRELIITLSDKSQLYLCHGKINDVLRHSQMIGMNVCVGHFHERFEIRHWTSKTGKLHWGMVSGCLIDDGSLAYAYNKQNIQRPIIGTSIIIEGRPKLIPLLMKENGRWTGVLPP